MKAKEYAQQYINSENKNIEMSNIMKSFFKEYVQIREQRHAHDVKAMLRILTELNTKYNTYVALVNKHYPVTKPLDYEYFRKMVYLIIPKIKLLW